LKKLLDLWFDSALLLKDINGKGLDLFNEDLDYAKKTKSYYFSNNIVFYRQRNKNIQQAYNRMKKFEEIIREFIPNVTKTTSN
jgi:hypothetical protein